MLREAEDVLDEDDYELLRDNNINYRPKVCEISFFDHGVVVIQCLNYVLFLFLRRLFLLLQESKKFKRLKKARRDTDEDRYGFSDEEFDGSGKGGRTAEEKLKRSLFGDDEGNTFEILPRL